MTSDLNSPIRQPRKLIIYPFNKHSSNKSQSVELNCPFQFNFMICVPIFRLILGFTSMKEQKSLMIIIGDVSRKCVFLSKQEIPDYVYTILYIHESTKLFIGTSKLKTTFIKICLDSSISHLGCMGRVLLYNTQPLKFTSQPLFVSELAQLPFQPMEAIIHLTHVTSRRAIGILSNRYFVLWQYSPNEELLLTFCNPHRYDFIRCHYIKRYNYIIFAFTDGLILIYQIDQMKQMRRYQNHWKKITDLKNNKTETLLLSSSKDHIINVWNLGIIS